MVGKARDRGLQFEPGQLEPGGQSGAGDPIAPNYAAPIVDSRKGIYAAFHPFHRLTHAEVGAAPGQAIASSAIRRRAERVAGYEPREFDAYRAAHPAVVPVVEQP